MFSVDFAEKLKDHLIVGKLMLKKNGEEEIRFK